LESDEIVTALRGVAIFSDLPGTHRDLYFQVRGFVLVLKVKQSAKPTAAA
jgi:hypothetical protein